MFWTAVKLGAGFVTGKAIAEITINQAAASMHKLADISTALADRLERTHLSVVTDDEGIKPIETE